MDKRFDTILSVAAVILVVFVMLASPAIASGEPSMEASQEPSMEMPSCSNSEVIVGVLFEAAGMETSANIEDILANMDTAEIATELRSLLDMTQLMTDEQLREQIITLAAAYGYSFTDAELNAIVRIVRSFEPLTVDELQAKLEQIRAGYMTVEEVRDGLSGLGDRLQAFIQKLVELFRSIFRKNGAFALSM